MTRPEKDSLHFLSGSKLFPCRMDGGGDGVTLLQLNLQSLWLSVWDRIERAFIRTRDSQAPN